MGSVCGIANVEIEFGNLALIELLSRPKGIAALLKALGYM
jgi:hypothetical protein